MEPTEPTGTALASPPQDPPGLESRMEPRPGFDDPNYRCSRRLEDKVAVITGGDSGIGRAVAVALAKEGAAAVIAYLDEHADAEETKSAIEAHGRRCELIAGDIGYEAPHPQAVIDLALGAFGRLDVLVNNAGVKMPEARFPHSNGSSLRYSVVEAEPRFAAGLGFLGVAALRGLGLPVLM